MVATNVGSSRPKGLIVATNVVSWGPKGLIVATNGGCGGREARISRDYRDLGCYFVGLGVGHAAGVGDVLGEAVGFGDGEAVGLGVAVGHAVGVGTGFRSFGPTWPMKGRRLPKLRMNGTAREPCSWGCKKSV